MSIENESEIQDWMKSFEALPEDRRDLVQRWFAMQKIIIENAGITPEDWFRHVQWAMDNPFDYSFINDFPAKEGKAGADSAKAKDETRDARKLVGGATKKTALQDGHGIKEKAQGQGLEKELFQRFMADSMLRKGRK